MSDKRAIIPFSREDVLNLLSRGNYKCNTKIQRDYRDKMLRRYKKALEQEEKSWDRQRAYNIITFGEPNPKIECWFA